MARRIPKHVWVLFDRNNYPMSVSTSKQRLENSLLPEESRTCTFVRYDTGATLRKKAAPRKSHE